METLTVVIKECAHCVITIKLFPPGGAMYTRPILQLMGNLHQSRRSTIAIMVDNLFFTPSVWCKVPNDHHSGVQSVSVCYQDCTSQFIDTKADCYLDQVGTGYTTV